MASRPIAATAGPIDALPCIHPNAAGLDIGSILSDMNSPLPNYRFSVMVQKTIDLCNEVKSLGARHSQTRTAEQTEIAWFWANEKLEMIATNANRTIAATGFFIVFSWNRRPS